MDHPTAGRALASLAAVLALSSCSGGGGQADPAPTAAPTSPAASTTEPGQPELPQARGGPLQGLPACEPPPPAAPATEVDGLVLPAGSVVTDVTENGPLVTVQGYVEQTPIAIRIFYQERRGLELFDLEDEVFEAETLYGSGEYRTYVKASAACAEGSTLLAVVGPAGNLPTVGN